MNIPIQINENSAEPLYHQIENQLRSLIITGQLGEGTHLPSIREFAGSLNCSVITVRRVYQDLENEGLLRTKQGTGTFVAEVEAGDRENYKLTAAREALQAAVQSGKAVGCSQEEMAILFREALQTIFDSK
ncbi:GntR family transcriptional regulator [Paenibacillus sp. JNUCC31]|uniref:GntR family transcriptional regulator n=1 Tax=unclassified Paenibacillus TaxID=185978 RepID=UPI00177D87A2|nr:GntR family transcriptional regulator [Paenibacillus sp. JNUCC-31]QOS82518.1 GntR family transcriptional regulator [Paenibacillus sp. JNUCC-31]